MTTRVLWEITPEAADPAGTEMLTATAFVDCGTGFFDHSTTMLRARVEGSLVQVMLDRQRAIQKELDVYPKGSTAGLPKP